MGKAASKPNLCEIATSTSGHTVGSLAGLGLIFAFRRCFKFIFWYLTGRGSQEPAVEGRLPLLGHALYFGRNNHRIHDALTENFARLGRTIQWHIGPWFAPLLMVHSTCDPRNVEHILKTRFDNYIKGKRLAEAGEEFAGHGIFVVDGEQWRMQRKTASNIFSRKNFSENMVNVFQEHAQLLARGLRERVESGKRCAEMQSLFFALTMDAFCEIAYGFPWHSMKPKEAPTSAAEAVVAGGGWSDLATPDTSTAAGRMLWGKHFDRAQEISTGRNFRPFWRLERLLLRLGLLSGKSQEAMLHESVGHIDRVIYEIVDRRAQEAQEERAKRNDLLSLFMTETSDKKYLRDIAVNFMLAGRDTTATTLTWLFWEVARCQRQNINILARIREEVYREAGDSGKLSFPALAKMKFCGACVRETVRLHAVVPMDGKIAVEDDVLPDGTLVAKGDMVGYHPYCMARDTGLWGSDAAEWRPERWLEMDHEPSSFLDCVFQAGPRICLGKEMALLEAKTVLVHLVRSGLSWTLPSGTSSEEATKPPAYRNPSATLTMAEPGLWLDLQFDKIS